MKRALKIFSILYTLFIIYYSVKPMTSDSIITKYKLTDSGMFFHLAGYLILSSSLFLSFYNKISVLKIFLICMFLSILLEFIQIFIVYRNFNIFDIVGNVIGLLSFLLFFTMLNKFHPSWFFRKTTIKQ